MQEEISGPTSFTTKSRWQFIAWIPSIDEWRHDVISSIARKQKPHQNHLKNFILSLLSAYSWHPWIWPEKPVAKPLGSVVHYKNIASYQIHRFSIKSILTKTIHFSPIRVFNKKTMYEYKWPIPIPILPCICCCNSHLSKNNNEICLKNLQKNNKCRNIFPSPGYWMVCSLLIKFAKGQKWPKRHSSANKFLSHYTFK